MWTRHESETPTQTVGLRIPGHMLPLSGILAAQLAAGAGERRSGARGSRSKTLDSSDQGTSLVMRACSRCGESMESGFTTSSGLVGGDRADSGKAQLLFIVPSDVSTSANPLKAFAQGVAHGTAFRSYPIVGWRCMACGALEFATEADPVG